MRGVENPAEAKAQLTFFGIYGTTEVVPLPFVLGHFRWLPMGAEVLLGFC